MNRFAILRSRQKLALSLIELVVGMAIFTLLLMLLFGIISQTSSTWTNARNQVGSFQSVRLAFNLLTRTLSQGTLNVYGDYDNPSDPKSYIRNSNLHFIIDAPQGDDFGQGNSIFFQAKLGKSGSTDRGMESLLNAVGYFVTYGKDPNLPDFLAASDRNRFRLMQYLEPSEDLTVYSTTDKQWFQKNLMANSTVIADNVILALFWPRLSEQEEASGERITENYLYDSRSKANVLPQPVSANQLPPLVTVTLVAIDEDVANRLANSAGPPTEITSCLSGLFKQPKSEAYAEDLAKLEDRLNQARIGYQLFTSTIPLRESKWTK